MIEMSEGRFQSVEVVRSGLKVAASVRLGHAGMATLIRHTLATSRSPAVIAAPGMVHAISGNDASSSTRSETPPLTANFTATSLIPDSRRIQL